MLNARHALLCLGSDIHCSGQLMGLCAICLSTSVQHPKICHFTYDLQIVLACIGRVMECPMLRSSSAYHAYGPQVLGIAPRLLVCPHVHIQRAHHALQSLPIPQPAVGLPDTAIPNLPLLSHTGCHLVGMLRACCCAHVHSLTSDKRAMPICVHKAHGS